MTLPKETPMIERLAQDVHGALSRANIAAYLDMPDDTPLVIARIVLKALREPTPRMISAGESAASEGIGKPVDDEALPRIWQSMIDAALNEGEG